MRTQIPGGDVAGIVEDIGDGSKVSAYFRLTWSCASMYDLSSACDTHYMLQVRSAVTHAFLLLPCSSRKATVSLA